MDVGPAELIIVLGIVLLLFGAKRLPELARGLGSAIHEFKAGAEGDAGDSSKERAPAAEQPAVAPTPNAPTPVTTSETAPPVTPPTESTSTNA